MKLVLLACLIACSDTRSAPTPTTATPAIALVAPAPAPPPPHAAPSRADILGPYEAVVPKRGVVISVWGLAGSSQLVFDADARTIEFDRVDMGSKKTHRTKSVDAKTRDELWALASATLTGSPPTWSHVTDVRIDLAIADGASALSVSADGEFETPSAGTLTTRLWKLVER